MKPAACPAPAHSSPSTTPSIFGAVSAWAIAIRNTLSAGEGDATTHRATASGSIATGPPWGFGRRPTITRLTVGRNPPNAPFHHSGRKPRFARLLRRRGFRTVEHTLELRPLHNRRPRRIRSHVLLCWLALLLGGVLEHATGQSRDVPSSSGSRTRSDAPTPSVMRRAPEMRSPRRRRIAVRHSSRSTRPASVAILASAW
jgi:hypothetical protein